MYLTGSRFRKSYKLDYDEAFESDSAKIETTIIYLWFFDLHDRFKYQKGVSHRRDAIHLQLDCIPDSLHSMFGSLFVF